MSGDCDLCGSYDHVESFHNCGNCKFWKDGACFLLSFSFWDTDADVDIHVYLHTKREWMCGDYEYKG